jgi:diacylglycerol kinase
MRARNIVHSFWCAFRGLFYAFRTQRNVRIHLTAALMVLAAAVWLGLPTLEVVALLAVIGFVLVSELLNTAVETLVDLVSPDFHPVAGTVKDIMAASVLVTALLAIIVGLLILGPPLWNRLGGGSP